VGPLLADRRFLLQARLLTGAQQAHSETRPPRGSDLKSAGAIVAMRFRDLFDFPKCPDEGGTKANDNAEENQGHGGGCEHGQHTLVKCKQDTTGTAKSRWPRCDNTGAGKFIPQINPLGSAPDGILQLQTCTGRSTQP
jgi:hypothetical protein